MDVNKLDLVAVGVALVEANRFGVGVVFRYSFHPRLHRCENG